MGVAVCERMGRWVGESIFVSFAQSCHVKGWFSLSRDHVL